MVTGGRVRCSPSGCGRSGAERASAAADPGDREPGAGRAVCGLRPPVRPDRPARVLPEKLLRALLLQALYSIRSERQLMERLDFDLLFRWFVGLGIDDPVWDHSTFSKNRDRLLAGDVAARFMAAVQKQPSVRRLLTDEHFSVDGTLIEAFASMKSFWPKEDHDGPASGSGGGRNRAAYFRRHKRRNDSHASTTDSDASLFRKGTARRAGLPISAISGPRTGMAWWCRPGPPGPAAGRNGRPWPMKHSLASMPGPLRYNMASGSVIPIR